MKTLHFGLILLFAATALAAEKRPNILWILGDDLGVELNCYGTAAAKTPTLDQLAASGMRYTHFYTTAPVCSAARSAWMTGMYAQTIRAHHHRTAEANKQPLPDGVRLLTHWFHDAGYSTANVAEFPADTGLRTGGKTDWNFKLTSEPSFDTRRWQDLKGRQPFFAQINFQEPHRAFHGPKVTDRAAVKIPPYYPEHPVTREDWASYLDSVAELDRKTGVVLKQLEVEGMADDTIIVFFGDNGRCHVRDKQFCYEEGLHVPLLIRWPKNFPAPRGFTIGKVSSQLLPAIDLAPTMLALAGAPVPPKMQGRVFLGDKATAPREFVFGGRDRCDETEMTIRTVRDARYRYIRTLTPEVPILAANKYKETQYPVWNLLKQLNAEGKLTPAQAFLCAPRQPEEQLFDMVADPDQLTNLVTSTKAEDTAALKRLRAALDGWMRETNDPEVAAKR
jgi:arylsulfatase A-like enzyme